MTKDTNKQEQQPGEDCEPDCQPIHKPAPAREGGGTTGAGNRSAGAANRTGGPTSGEPAGPGRRPDVPPDA